MVKCIKDFVQAEYQLCKDETYSGPAAVESWMLDSYPAYFVKAEAGDIVADVPSELVDDALDAERAARVELADIDAPPVDKMVKKPKGRK